MLIPQSPVVFAAADGGPLHTGIVARTWRPVVERATDGGYDKCPMTGAMRER
jgi:hypothetical protein